MAGYVQACLVKVVLGNVVKHLNSEAGCEATEGKTFYIKQQAKRRSSWMEKGGQPKADLFFGSCSRNYLLSLCCAYE